MTSFLIYLACMGTICEEHKIVLPYNEHQCMMQAQFVLATQTREEFNIISYHCEEVDE